METRVHISVKGVVQGVGYRYFAQNEAHERGLAGWVRNCPNGSVELVVEGSAGLIEELVQRLRVGPPASRVTNVHVQKEDYTGELDAFSIRP